MTDFVDISEMEELREMLDELCELYHGLTEFEMCFILRLSEWDECFTEPLAGALRKIHERHC